MPNKFREHVKGCGTFIDLYVVGPKESRIEAAKNNQDEAVSSIAIDVDDEEDQDETRDDYGNDNDDNDNDDNTDRKDANNDNDKAKNNVQPQKNQISTDTINKLQDETALPSDYRSSFNLISSHPISVPALYPSLTPTPTPTPFLLRLRLLLLHPIVLRLLRKQHLPLLGLVLKTRQYGDDNDSVDARQKNLLNQQLGWGAIVKALGRNWQGLIGWHYIDGAINSKIILEELIRYYYRGFQYLKWMMIGTRKLFTEGGNYSAQERGLNPLEQRVSVVNYARSTARYLMFLLRRPNCQKNGHVRSHLERMCRIVSAEAEAEAKAKQGGGRKRKRDESHLGKEATVEDEDAKVSEWIDTAIGDDDNDNDNDNDIIMMEEEALDEKLEQQRQEEEAAGIQKDQNNDRGQQDGDDVDDDVDEKEERRGFYFRKDEAYSELHEALKLAFLRQYEFSESIRDTEIVKFLACLSLRDDGTSRYAYEISSFFAPLIYTCRLVAASELQRLVEEGKVTLSSIPEFHTAGSFAYTHVFRYISLGKRNIYDILYETNKIVRDVTRTEGYANTLEGLNPSRVLFRPAFNSKYTIVGSHINNMVVLDLSDLSHLYESMFSRLQLLLEELCFGVDMEKLLPSSLLQSVGDDINNSKLGYSFFKESVDIRMTRSVLLRTVLKNDELRHRFLPLVSRDDFYDYFEELVQVNKKKSQNGTQEQDWTDKEKEKEKKKGSRIEKKNDMSWMDDFDAVFKKDLKWSKTSILNYETKATKFNELLFCLVYISAGQPARAKEMVHWTLKNSKYKARELYLMFGRLMIYSRYDKTRNMKFAEKPIPRFLPESLSTLALRYYALVRPFQAFLSSVKTGNKQAAAVYTNAMFVVNGGKRLDSGMPYRIFPKVTYECLGKPLGFRNYRHIAHYFKERNLEEDMSKNSYFDLQAGHTRSTALLIYGRTMDKLHYLPADYFANFFRASFQWQELLRIKDNSAHGLLVEQCNPILKEIRESTKELKSMIQSGKQAVEEEGKEKQKGEEKSPKQKVCVSCFSATTTTTATATATATKEQPSWSDTGSRGIPPSQIYVQLCRWALAQFCGLSAKFRSKKQFHSVYFSVQGQKNLIIVLPTASGKSLSFLLPALIDKTIRPNNTTLVVVPAISLREDMMRRVNETGLVECTNTWTQYRNQPVTPSLKLPDLFILTYESALSNSALAFFESLGVAGRLARVVVDEAHSLLTDSTWRNTLLQAPRLSALFAPIHLLSGTFPRPLETRASKTFGATFTVVRDISTARQNLLYLLRPLVANAFLNELSVLMQRASVYEGDGRVIVFCQKSTKWNTCNERFNGRIFSLVQMPRFTREI
ncbi:uncharacterized protein SOCG_16235 [Schizosaccharomyces octosporus yFS286]|uniref:Helicase ATP-binding domain-containing protein n=1 Tax=Schizosaccharomyces octosporus (strain yFS286) TaxID=483514 RepID=S9RN45_SCHOY|nr:uncharacterized protein SOCG_16235 [Schizosaccharomyces octosporus yFS286]EPX75399.1 hypothetical protein SOCG_16235 [Schizosaccharomyces octosporus yFS286]